MDVWVYMSTNGSQQCNVQSDNRVLKLPAAPPPPAHARMESRGLPARPPRQPHGSLGSRHLAIFGAFA